MAFGRRRRGPKYYDPEEQKRQKERYERLTQKYGSTKAALDVMGGKGKWVYGPSGKLVPAASLETEKKVKKDKAYTYKFKPVPLVMSKKYRSESGGGVAKAGVQVRGKLLYRADWKLNAYIQKASNYRSFMKKNGVPLESGRFVSDPEYAVTFDGDGYPIVKVGRKYYYQGEGKLSSNQKRDMKYMMAVPLPGVFEGTLHEAVNDLSAMMEGA